MDSGYRSNAFVVFLTRYFWIIAIGLFLALQSVAAPDQYSVFSFVLKIPFVADNPHILRFTSIFSEFLMGTLASYFCFAAVRLLGQKVEFRPFWSTLLILLGVVSFLKPILANANAAWVVHVLKVLIIIIALCSVYKLDLAVAFSVSAFGYLVLLAPVFFVDFTPVNTSARAAEQTNVMKELKTFGVSLKRIKEYARDQRKLDGVMNRLLGEAEKGNPEAQYDLALIYLVKNPVKDESPEQNQEQAFKWLTASSNQGFTDAQIALGKLYLEGGGIPINTSEAEKLYRAVAEKGNMDAEAMMGWLYAHGLGVDWNAQEALLRYNNAAHGGSALGLWGLADLFITGNGVERNRTQGMSLYAQAAKEGCAPAMAKLGLLMLAGADNPTQSDQGIAYIHAAARAGVAEAQYLYMMIYGEGIYGELLPYTVLWWGNQLLFSARAGNADAQWYWGLICENGLLGHSEPEKAWTWISQAAYKGFPAALDSEGDYLASGLAGERNIEKALVAYQTAAQFNANAMQTLVLWYQNGIDVPRDLEKAHYYLGQLRLWATRGDAQSEYYLGNFYRNGLVVPQSYAQALMWYQEAAENGIGQSSYRIAEMYENGEGVAKDERTAFRHYRRAASLLYLPAFYNVAIRLAEGIGTAKNAQEAREWFLRIQRGAQRGTPAHQLSLARLAEKGLFVPRDEASAAARYQAAARYDVDAERALAKMYWDGRGVRKNLVLAYCYLNDAVRHGDGRAKRMADTLMKKLSLRDRAQAQKLSLTFRP